MRSRLILSIAAASCLLLVEASEAQHLLSFPTAEGPGPTAEEARVFMPGTQPGQLTDPIAGANSCRSCHEMGNDPAKPVEMWRGSMMSQAARDPLFWAALTVAAQDSYWLEGTPEGTDSCLRCHMPAGWLDGRSEPFNGSAMGFDDFDGVTCEFCHRMVDPFFEDTYDRARECVSPGCDWDPYWDEATTASETAALAAHGVDTTVSSHVQQFDGSPFYDGSNQPVETAYTENGSGQYFVDPLERRRGPFEDAGAIDGVPHQFQFSRYHRSKYFCSTCHDVSNTYLENRGHELDPTLPTETVSAHSYGHVERTFSEFMLSDFGLDGGAPGAGFYAPDVFETSRAGNVIASCQDCHMPDVSGRACVIGDSSVLRPTESLEHPQSGVPSHELTGANLWITSILASTQEFSANYDPVNQTLLGQGPAILTLDMGAGITPGHEELLAGADRALANLQNAAAIESVRYSSMSGDLEFRVVNRTGHKLITGYPEGRRMWVNVQLFDGMTLVHEINPYDDVEDTLRGLPQRPSGPFLGANEAYVDELVYEAQMSSSLTGETKSQHFLLGDAQYKDNRIPPRGFRIGEAADRLAVPVWAGAAAPGYFTTEEYAGGWDDVSLTLPTGADRVEVRLYYQVTSREYVEFLQNEITGTGDTTLTDPPPGGGATSYIVQDEDEDHFDQLRAWGTTIWNLWDHNRDLPGAAPVLMTTEIIQSIFEDGFETGDTTQWSSQSP
ncbi:MAG: cytochrome c family protein [Thermoanaerobaculia bacterium]|nr:cytochrome c family protein [Thermoanaerobaculia bacterium]